MKLNWFSPLPPEKTDIAHFTARILPALCAKAEILLWTDQAEWDKNIEQHAKVYRFNPHNMPWADFNRADMSFFNIGNNPDFHGSIWEVSLKHPGVTILHDISLQHFFGGLFLCKWQKSKEYLELMKYYYGDNGLNAANVYLKEECTTDFMAKEYPLTQLALKNSLGVIVHTNDAFNKLIKKNRYPVCYTPLPYNINTGSKHSQNKKSKYDPGLQSYFRLVVFGYLGPNRRLDSLLEALSSFPEKDRFFLDIYGEIWDKSHVKDRIESLGLKSNIALHGFVSERTLSEALAAAHLAFNLRYPTMGEASGSQLRIWEHALPSIVTKTGWYASLPEDTVAFVNPDNEITDIHKHLHAFLANPRRFELMGKKGCHILEKFHSPEKYASAVTSFIADVKEFRPKALAFNMAERVSTDLNIWIRPGEPDEKYRNVASEIYKLSVEKQ